MVKKTNLKCISCGGNLIFSPSLNAVKCNSCNKLYKINSKKQNTKLDYTENEGNINSKTKTTNCVNCGAKLELKPREITKTCPYCQTSFVLEKEEMVGLTPNGIIPFNFNKEKAIEYYKSGVKKKHFLPNKFKKSPTVGVIHEMYIPCFSFDSNTFSSYSGRLSYTETHTDSNGHTHSTTHYKNISGKKDMNFENVVVESSEETVQHLFSQIEPFDFDEVYEYNPSFLMGYKAQSYNTSLKDCKVISNNIIKERIKNAILSNYHYDRVEYFNLNTTFSKEKYSYVLLPLYFIDYTYKDKNYKTYINGQTGKIGNDLPQSKIKKFFAFFLPIFFFALLFILAYALS